MGLFGFEPPERMEYAEPWSNPGSEFWRRMEKVKVSDSFVVRMDLLLGGTLLYAISSGDRVKLGRSLNPQARLQALSTASSVPLELLGVIPECVLSEKEAHLRWAHLRQSGEWFDRTPELDTWISEWPTLVERKYPMMQRMAQLVQAVLSRTQGRGGLNRLDGIQASVFSRAERQRQAAERAKVREAERNVKLAIKAAIKAAGCGRCRGPLGEQSWQSGICLPCTRAENPDRVRKAEAEVVAARARLARTIRDLAIIRARHRLAKGVAAA